MGSKTIATGSTEKKIKSYIAYSMLPKNCIFATTMNITRNNIILGIILSLGITVMVMVPRFIFARGSEHIDTLALHTFLMLLITWFGHLWLLENKKWRQLISNTWLRSSISIILITIIIHIFLQLITPVLETTQMNEMFQRPLVLSQKWNFPRVLIWNIIYHWILFSQRIILEKKSAEIEIRRINELALEAKLSSLHEQLSPHFMFNSLNTLSSMTHDVSVQNFVDKLAGVYRYLLTNKDQKTVTVQNELDFALKYWHILKERLGSAIEINIAVESDLNTLIIPPMTLQTLIENAIKHNKATIREPLAVSIVEEKNHIVVSNYIQPKIALVGSNGVGLYNLTERYKLLFNKEVEVIKNEKFTVKLPIVSV